MRKVKIELQGYVSLTINNQLETVDIYKLGEHLMPGFAGMLDATLINNRMLIIEMQQSGIKFQETFHYKLLPEKKEKIAEYIKDCIQKISIFLEAKYDIDNVDYQLTSLEVFDDDYCVLPLDEAKADLTREELKGVMLELTNYQPTVRKSNKKTGQHVYF